MSQQNNLDMNVTELLKLYHAMCEILSLVLAVWHDHENKDHILHLLNIKY